MSTETKFQDKSARVILVDSSGAVRQLLSEVAKSIGFSNAQAVASITDAHNILESEEVDWLIVPLAADQAVTGMHTVRMITSFPELRNVRVSLLLDENETWCLPKAFECGLLSYHMKPFTKDSLKKDLEELMRHFESHDWNSTETSAEYLRKALRASNSTTELLQLEKDLLDMYPSSSTQLLNLAHAQNMIGQVDQAKVTLKQASFIDAKLAPAIEAKAQELFGSTDLTPTSADAAAGRNVLGLQSVVLVDSDDVCRAATKTIFEELGVTSIFDFADGEQAWEHLDANEEPGMIVMEWRIPKLTGPLLMQRFRSKGFLKCPVVVQSSLVKVADMSLIREMGVANVVQKPSDKEMFLKTIIWTIQQDRMPTEQQTLENKIRTMLGIKNLPEAETLAARYFSDPSISTARKNVIKAEIAFAKEDYTGARDLAIESLKGSKDLIFALNILGKSLMVLRQFEAALKCFQKAQNMSPINLERIISMAEGQAEVGEVEAAADAVAIAKDIDPESPTVQEGEVKVAIASGASEKAKKLLAQMENVGNLISYLNNKAVSHAKCGLNEEGIELYRKTLEAVPDDKVELKSTVAYNMALAKIRKNDLSDALVDLDEILRSGETKVSKKALSLKQRLESSLNSNSTFMLREADEPQDQAPVNPASPTQDESQEADATTITNTAIAAAPGDTCCYLVYKSTTDDSEQLKKILQTPPKFKQRKAIARGETFIGADANSGNKAS